MSNEDPPPPLSEQTRRPADTALLQQRVKAWYPILDPWWVIAGFAILGAIFVPVGKSSYSVSLLDWKNLTFEHCRILYFSRIQ